MLAYMLGGGEDERDPYGDPADPYGDSVQSERSSGRFGGADLSAPDLSAHEGIDRAHATESLTSRAHRQWTPLARALAATGDQWTLLIVLALARGPRRLSDLRSQLPGISTGVLNRHLQQMLGLGLIMRQRFRELPPRVEYKLAPGGDALLPIVTDLARWGMLHAWSLPQPRERVDIGALLRLLPTLLAHERPPDGVVEMIVELPEAIDRHLFNIAQGRLTSEELGSMMPWSRIAGAPGDWIHALGPGGQADSLQITGDRHLALALLQALPRMS
jgi:DNA-binding HxlR family transcriptional regulator